MRTMVILGAGASLMTAGVAGAQHTMSGGHGAGAAYPQPGRVIVHSSNPSPTVRAPMRQSRWGSKVGGQWWGGANAPGGYTAYRLPVRGYRLPTYWVAPRFYVTDWRSYGLTQPTGGQNWVRYYDDAVLIDGTGSVYDHRGGLDWDRIDQAGGYDDHGYDARGPERRSGAAGAVAGAIVGGVAGNVIGGRGNRLAGTAIGAGVGAAAGYGLDRATDPARRGSRGDGRTYGGRYGDDREPPMAPDRGPDYDREDHAMMTDSGEYGRRGPSSWTSADGRTIVTTSGGAYAGGYAGSGYGANSGSVIYAPAGAVTTVTIASAPVITTTTTTEYYEDAVTYTRAPVVRRKVYGKRLYRAKVKPRCYCR